MATTNKWLTPLTIASALTTELNALANNGVSAASAAIDNLTDLYQFCDVEIVLATLTPTGSPLVNVYVVYSLDDTNYDDVSISMAHLLCTIPVSTGAGAKRNSRTNLVLAPLKFKLFVENKTGVAFGATTNLLKIRRHFEQSV